MLEKLSSMALPLQIAQIRQGVIFASISILSFFVPFGLGHPQWLVGSAVNTCLFLAALYLPQKYYLPVIVLPSLGVLARGAVFGPFTPFLIYFLPFIWLGNLALILVFKKYNFIFAAFAKFSILFAAANVYFYFELAPKMFLQSMGAFQLVTALAGGLISYIFLYARSRRIN